MHSSCRSLKKNDSEPLEKVGEGEKKPTGGGGGDPLGRDIRLYYVPAFAVVEEKI